MQLAFYSIGKNGGNGDLELRFPRKVTLHGAFTGEIVAEDTDLIHRAVRRGDNLVFECGLVKNLNTYEPYAGELYATIRKYAPQAKIMLHQTWAYRTDDPRFVPKNEGKQPHTHQLWIRTTPPSFAGPHTRLWQT